MKKVKDFLKGNKGTGEMIGMALLIIFLVIVPSPSIKSLGNTIKTSFDRLNTDVNGALTEGK